MDDRRTALALFLMALVMIGWSYWYQGTQPAEVQEVSDGESGERLQSEGDLSREEVDEGEWLGDVETEAEVRTVVVKNEDVEVVFDSRGAGIRSCRVLDYKYGKGHPREGEPVQLFGSDTTGVALTYVVDRVGGTLDLGQAVFSTTAPDTIELKGDEEGEVEFELRLKDGTRVRRGYRLSGKGHVLQGKTEYEGRSRVGSYVLRWDVPLRVTETNPKIDIREFRGMVFADAKYREVQLKHVDNGDREEFDGRIDWVGAATRYFVVAILPGDRRKLKAFIGAAENRMEPVGFRLDLKRTQVNETSFSDRFKVFLGPKDYDELVGLGRGVDRAVNFGASPIRPISKVIFAIMVRLYGIIPSYGLVIIIMSVMVRLLFWPLSLKSLENARKMRHVAPKVKKIQEKYKNNPRLAQKEVMAVYREHGVNHAAGCLPMLVQMPVLFALFVVFRTTIAFRGETFLGYIPDLSAPDPYWILPILAGLTMLAQQRLTPMTDEKQKMMSYAMSGVFVVFFINMPAGLALYMLVSNVLSALQQWVVNRSGSRMDASVGKA